ncbi:hypothetical protein [Nocardia sp. NPDC050710]|uniref:hypothetical protein n=1 Tax=Nocardia sp. NPDC050710 TaxID=3157220 RepID=UPI0033DB44D6
MADQFAYLLRCELQDLGDLAEGAVLGPDRSRGACLSLTLPGDRVRRAGAGVADPALGGGDHLLEVVLRRSDRRARFEELRLCNVDATQPLLRRSVASLTSTPTFLARRLAGTRGTACAIGIRLFHGDAPD